MAPVSPEDEKVWTEMWLRKDEGREMFAHAELLVDVEASVSEGTFREKERKYVMKAGSTVLITMASRFGDLGIRGTDIDKEVHGYHARVVPEQLRNPRFLSDGGTPWRKQMMEKFGEWDSSEPASPRPKLEDFLPCTGATQAPCQVAVAASPKKRRKRSKS